MLLAQESNHGHDARRGLVRGRTRPRRRILQAGDAGLLEPPDPLRHRPDTHRKPFSGGGIAPALEQDTADQKQTR